MFEKIDLPQELDLYNVGAFKEQVSRLVDSITVPLIINMEHTVYLDSSGIGILLYIFTNAVQRNILLKFINFTKPVQRLLSTTRIADILPTTDSLDTAIREINSHVTTKNAVIRRLVIDEGSALFERETMHYNEFTISLDRVRRLSLLIVQKAPPEIRELNLLEQQISEIIKNAVKHGNKNDPQKKIRVWYSFTDHSAHLIVEDEGEGFRNLEAWNDFYEKRKHYHRSQEYDKLMNYLSYRAEQSDETDGGNAMFAAVEYWNEGVVFNTKKNCIAVKRLIQ